EPLVAALGLTICERGGRVSVCGPGPAEAALDRSSLALPDEGGSLVAERVLESPPTTARVRFVDGEGDYRTGTASVRRSGEGDAVDFDEWAVCTMATARRAAERALGAVACVQLTIRPGPLEALRLEAGDVVTIEEREGPWRVVRVDLDEAPRAVL